METATQSSVTAIEKDALKVLGAYIVPYRRALAAASTLVLATVGTSMYAPWVLKNTLDDITNHNVARLPVHAAMLIGVAVVEGLLRWTTREGWLRIAIHVERDIRQDLLAHLQRQSQEFYQAFRCGDIMTRTTDDLGTMRTVIYPSAMYTIQAAAAFVSASLLMAQINPTLMLLAYVPLAGLLVAVMALTSVIQRRFGRVQAEYAEITSHLQETLGGIRTLKSYRREAQELLVLERLTRKYLHACTAAFRTSCTHYPLALIMFGLAVLAVLGVGGTYVMRARMTLGELVAFGGYLALIAWPIMSISVVSTSVQRGRMSMGRVAALLRAEQPCHVTPTRASFGISGAIAVRDLTFQYSGAAGAALNTISFDVEPGDRVAIVGPVGSGKSTLVKLLVRLLEPPVGTIFIDGRDVLDIPVVALRSAIGFVPDDAFVFSDSIRNNLLFGRDDKSLRDGIRAARTACLTAEIDALPQRFETLVGAAGMGLSGGQRQRIGIARAVAVEPHVLIVDDAMSSVDGRTADRLMDALEHDMKGRTIILVCPSLAVARRCNRILVLRDGRLVEQGGHETSMALDDCYAELYRSHGTETGARR